MLGFLSETTVCRLEQTYQELFSDWPQMHTEVLLVLSYPACFPGAWPAFPMMANGRKKVLVIRKNLLTPVATL